MKIDAENIITTILKREANNLVMSAELLSKSITEQIKIIDEIYDHALKMLHSK